MAVLIKNANQKRGIFLSYFKNSILWEVLFMFIVLAGGLLIIIIAVIIAVVSSVVSAVAADSDESAD